MLLLLCYSYYTETNSIHLIRPSDMLLSMILNVPPDESFEKALSSPVIKE